MIRRSVWAWPLLLILPWAGLAVVRGVPDGFWAFPPGEVPLEHPPVIPWVLWGLVTGFALTLGGMTAILVRAWPGGPVVRGTFPWWGWVSLAGVAAAWVLAWTRFPWFASLQAHTYILLWLPFTVLLQAVACRVTGTCLLRRCPVFFAGLYGVSAVFWWFFEYLNRFTWNWEYLNVGDFSAVEYAVFATLSFSTVLPATAGVYEILCGIWRKPTFPVFAGAGRQRQPVAGMLLLGIGAVLLVLMGVFPFVLYPFVWLAPLWFLEGWRLATGRPGLVIGAEAQAWPRLVLMMLAALICGVCWETWNLYSHAKWIYHIPYAGALHLFEMPLPGYAGYLPFGLHCIGIVGVMEEWVGNESGVSHPPSSLM